MPALIASDSGGGAAEHRIGVRHPHPRVGERLIGVEHLQALVDAEDQRQPGERIVGQRAVVACLVLVVRRGGGPPEQRALLDDRQLPGARRC